MNELTQEEFQNRILDLHRAEKIFIETGLTKNLSVAFRVYQEIFAEHKKQLVLNTADHGRRPPALFDGLNRPTCPVCGKAKMLFRTLPLGQELKVQLLCEDPTCDTVLNSREEMKAWIERMKGADPIDVSGLERVSKRAPIPGRKWKYLDIPCPECGSRIYELEVCCGAPEGLIECEGCDWKILPSVFYNKQI
jgi:hypothetical protein